eukprot:7277834-Prymnesium_polylepis.1
MQQRVVWGHIVWLLAHVVSPRASLPARRPRQEVAWHGKVAQIRKEVARPADATRHLTAPVKVGTTAAVLDGRRASSVARGLVRPSHHVPGVSRTAHPGPRAD